MHLKPSISILVTLDFKDTTEDFIKPFFDSEIGKPDYQIIVIENVGRNILKLKNKTYTTPGGCVIEVIRTLDTSRAHQRNIALKKAKADIVLLYAGDFVPSPQTIPQHLKFHRENPEEQSVAIGPGIFIREKRTTFMSWLEDEGAIFGVPFLQYNKITPVDFFYGANTSLKRSFLTSVGPFDENFKYDSSEDYDMGIRLLKKGMKAYVVPQASAIHEHDVSITDRLMLLGYAGQSAVLLDKKYPASRPWIHLRTINLDKLQQEAHSAIREYYSKQDLSLLHTYFQKVSDLAFASAYQKALKKHRMCS